MNTARILVRQWALLMRKIPKVRFRVFTPTENLRDLISPVHTQKCHCVKQDKEDYALVKYRGL